MKFSEFIELDESFDTVADFYMTQDTDLPNRVVAAFNILGSDYVMDMAKFTKEGLYIMDLGLIVSKNKGYFRFKNPSHIKPVLGTTIKALEATMPFLGPQIAGLAISLPAKVSKNYVALMKLLMQKTYLKQQFDFLPVNHVGASHQYLLLIRKGRDPKMIFKTKTFKDYGFAEKYNKNVPVDTDALDALKPVKMHKMTYDITPSTKFQYKDYVVDEPTLANFDDVLANKPIIDRKAQKKVENDLTQTVEKTVSVTGQDKPAAKAMHDEIEKTKTSLKHAVASTHIAKNDGPGLAKHMAMAMGELYIKPGIITANGSMDEWLNKTFVSSKIRNNIAAFKIYYNTVKAGDMDIFLKMRHYTDAQISSIKQSWSALDNVYDFFNDPGNTITDIGLNAIYKSNFRKAALIWQEAQNHAQAQEPVEEVPATKPEQSKFKAIAAIDDTNGPSMTKALAIALGDLYLKDFKSGDDAADDFEFENYKQNVNKLYDIVLATTKNTNNSALTAMGYSFSAINLTKNFSEELIKDGFFDTIVHGSYFYRVKIRAAYNLYSEFFLGKTGNSSDDAEVQTAIDAPEFSEFPKAEALANATKFDNQFTAVKTALTISLGDLYFKNVTSKEELLDRFGDDNYAEEIVQLQKMVSLITTGFYNNKLMDMGYSDPEIKMVQDKAASLLKTDYFDTTKNTSYSYRNSIRVAYDGYRYNFLKGFDEAQTKKDEAQKDEAAAKAKLKAETVEKNVASLKASKEISFEKSLEFVNKQTPPPSLKSMTEAQMRYYENLVAIVFGETILAGYKTEEAFMASFFADINDVKQINEVKNSFAHYLENNLYITRLPDYINTTVRKIIVEKAILLQNSGLFTSEDLSLENFAHIMKWAYVKYKKYYFDALQNDLDGSALAVADIEASIKAKAMAAAKKEKEKSFFDNFADDNKTKLDKINSHTAVDVGIQFQPIDIQKDLENSIGLDFYNKDDGKSPVYHPSDVAQAMMQTPYYKWVEERLQNEHKFENAVGTYTGSGYKSMNHRLRKMFNPNYKTSFFSNDTTDFSFKGDLKNKFNALKKAFNEIPPLEQGMWLFRNCTVKDIKLPEDAFTVDENIVDAAFISCSVDAKVFDGGNTKFMIYVPKGSRILPIFNHSNSSNSEKEIILPPMSVLRPIDIMVGIGRGSSDIRQFVKCIYMGTAMNSFLDKHGVDDTIEVDEEFRTFRKFKEFRMMAEEDDKKKKEVKDEKIPDPFDKASLEGPNKEDSRMIMDMIKKGIFKVEK